MNPPGENRTSDDETSMSSYEESISGDEDDFYAWVENAPLPATPLGENVVPPEPGFTQELAFQEAIEDEPPLLDFDRDPRGGRGEVPDRTHSTRKVWIRCPACFGKGVVLIDESNHFKSFRLGASRGQ
jgi:hypothetical protein